MGLKNKLSLVSLVSVFFVGGLIILLLTNRMSVYKDQVLESFRTSLIMEKQTKLQAVVDTAYSTLKPVFENAQGVELEKKLAQQVASLRFVEGDPDSYFYIHDLQGVVIAHGSKPQNVGKSEWDLKNSKNQYIVRNIVTSAKSGDGFTVFDGYRPTEDAFFPKMTFSKFIPSHGFALTTGFYIDDVEIAVAKKKEFLDKSYSTIFWSIAGISIITALVVAFFSYLMIARTLMPLDAVTRQLTELSRGGGDLTARLNILSKDEVGLVAESFNQFVAKLQSMFIQLSEVSSELSASTTSADALYQQTQTQIENQQQKVGMVAVAIEEMSSATQDIAKDAEASAGEVKSCFESTQKGHETTNKTKAAVERLNSEIGSTVQHINNLNANAGNISQIIETIQGIAEQTNLLALNAAIEAARAGEAGRGFAVVADEVRGLSQKTTESASEIRDMILELQSTTESATESIQATGQSAQSSVEGINEVEQQFDAISSAMERVQEMAMQIASASEEHRTVSDEVSKNTSEVKDIAESVSLTSEKCAEETRTVNDKVQVLNGLLEKFQI